MGRIPFDVGEAESELVSGWNTELKGLEYGMMAALEYGVMITLSSWSWLVLVGNVLV